MREIKFRAWDGEKMCDFFHCWLEPEKIFRGIRLDASYRTSLTQCAPKAIMQYTGIKDRNGVEVYEGDILGGVTRVHRVVRYNLLGFTCEEALESLYGEDASVVIGNIYENPEITGVVIK